LLAWLLPVGVSLYFIFAQGITTWYFVLPSWIASGVLFLVFSRMRGIKSV
jgi:NCS1 family nucleobase:cation symporter-1